MDHEADQVLADTVGEAVAAGTRAHHRGVGGEHGVPVGMLSFAEQGLHLRLGHG